MTDLEQRARKLFPESPTLQRKWLAAVRYLRSRDLWVLDKATPTPSWGIQYQEAA